MVTTITLESAMTLQEVLDLLQEHQELIISDGKKALAKVTSVQEPVKKSPMPPPGLFPGVVMSDDFNDPLPDEFWFGTDDKSHT